MTIYGPGIGMDGLGNTVVKSGCDNSYRFRASQSSALNSYRVYIIANGNTGYSNGTGGSLVCTLRTDDGTANHFPSSTVLATANTLTPGNPDSAEMHTVTFPSPYTVTAGVLYHLFFHNSDASPSVNYCSLDGIFAASATNPRQPKYPNTDWGWVKDGPTWDERTNQTACLDIAYANGKHDGVGYMELSYGSSRGLISGATQMIREAFTPSATVTVTAVGVYLHRESGTNPLSILLETAAGAAIETVTIPASAIPIVADRSGNWATVAFASAHVLSAGVGYHLRLSCPSTSTYAMDTIRKGSVSWGFNAQTEFSDGQGQKFGGGSWPNIGRTGEDDLAFYFTVSPGVLGAALAATITAQSTMTATLTTHIALAATITAQSTMTADLTTGAAVGAALAATITAHSGMTATLTSVPVIPPGRQSRAAIVASAGAPLKAPAAYPQAAYTTLVLTTVFWGGDSFIMTIGGAAQGASALVPGALLWLPDEGNAVYLVESVQTDKTGASRTNAELTVAGRAVDGFIGAERIIIPASGMDYDHLASVSSETAMKHYVRDQAGMNADPARQIPSLIVAPDRARGATIAPMDARYQFLGDVLLQIGLLGPLGWGTTLDTATGNIIWDVVVPADRSASVFLDFEFSTITSWQDVVSILASTTLAVVAGQGDLAARDVEVRYQGAVAPTGLARREAFIDARDVALGDLATLDARGDAYLAANAPVRSTTAVVNQFGSFQPGRDFFLGDIVLLHDPVASVNENARIVQMVKTYDVSAAAPTIAVSVGKPFSGASAGSAAPSGGAPDAGATSGGVGQIIGQYFADLSVGGANLVTNSSFESAVAGSWIVGANWDCPYTAGGIVGAQSARVELIAQVADDLVTATMIAVSPLDDYWVSFWSYLSAYTDGIARCQIREYDVTSALLATTSIALTAVELIPTRHALHFGIDNTTPDRIAWQPTTSQITVAFLTDSPGATLTWQVDAVQVERGAIMTAYAPAPQELIDQQIGTTQIADDSITTEKVIAHAITTGLIAAGAITTLLLDAAAVIANVANVGGTVTIDSTGITLKDLNGTTGLTSAGFAGSWSSFISDGLYNSVLHSATVGAVANGSTTAIPYWVPTLGSLTAAVVADATWPGGHYIEGTPSGPPGALELTSSIVPITPLLPLEATATVAWIMGAGVGNIQTTAMITFYAADGTTVLATPLPSSLQATASATTPQQYVFGPVMPVAGARFASLTISMYENGGHSASTRLRIGGGSLVRSSVLGSQATAFPDQAGPYLPWGSTQAIVADQSVIQPITINAPMVCTGCAIWNTDATLARSFEWRVFYDTGDASGILSEVQGLHGSASWTAGAASERSAGVAGFTTGFGLAPGNYWLIVRNRHASNTLGLARNITTLGAGAVIQVGAVKSATGALGATFDMSTITAQAGSAYAAWLQSLTDTQFWG